MMSNPGPFKMRERGLHVDRSGTRGGSAAIAPKSLPPSSCSPRSVPRVINVETRGQTRDGLLFG